jgi:hypothetical protein
MTGVPSIGSVKVKMMEASLSCLIYGLLGLLPGVGVIFACIAGWHSGRARALEKYHWNPAHRLRILGMTCAIIGVLTWGTVDILVIWHISGPHYPG